MLQDLILLLEEAQGEVVTRAQSAKFFLELADPKRLSRAADMAKGDAVQILNETSEGVEGACVPSGGGEPYRVSFRVRALRIRGATCTCHDGLQGETCKHVLALCILWLLKQRETWSKLKEAIEVLRRGPSPVMSGT